MRKGFILFTLIAVALSSVALADATKAPLRNVKLIGGPNDPPPPPALTQGPTRFQGHHLDELVGDAYRAGTTWYEYQHNGTTGKMIDVDEMGWVHVIWMNGLNSSHSDRHVYYNLWDPETESFFVDGGIQVDNGQRGGYVSQATTRDGRCYPVFHQETQTTDAFAAASIDFLPQSGAFSAFEPPHLVDNRCGSPEDMEIIWPHAVLSPDESILHMVTSENPCTEEAGDPQKIYYSRGYPEIDGDGFGQGIDWEDYNGSGFFEIDTVMVLAVDVAASRNTDRVVIAWAKSRDALESDTATQHNNDIVYQVSDDGGLTWGQEINITNFAYPDWDCVSQDTVECDRDSFRVYTDLSVILDDDDWIHIAFTTKMYYALEGTISRYASQIWHWGEEWGEMSPIHAVSSDYYMEIWPDDLGDWQYILQRPNLSFDPMSGDLFCAFQFRDSTRWSQLGLPEADAWISRSCDDGRSWSWGTKITDTDGGQDTPAGDCLHERDITLSEVLTSVEGVPYLHVEYVLDGDVGGAVGDNPTGVPTLCPVFYQRINADLIPREPRWDHLYPVLHIDSSDVPYGGDPDPDFPCANAVDNRDGTVPATFALYQNFPNPFNPATQIQFDLRRDAAVTLKVFNLLGQEVATVLDAKRLTAGTQIVDFHAGGLPSGVYVYRMEVDGFSQARKMFLMK